MLSKIKGNPVNCKRVKLDQHRPKPGGTLKIGCVDYFFDSSIEVLLSFFLFFCIWDRVFEALCGDPEEWEVRESGACPSSTPTFTRQ